MDDIGPCSFATLSFPNLMKPCEIWQAQVNVPELYETVAQAPRFMPPNWLSLVITKWWMNAMGEWEKSNTFQEGFVYIDSRDSILSIPCWLRICFSTQYSSSRVSKFFSTEMGLMFSSFNTQSLGLPSLKLIVRCWKKARPQKESCNCSLPTIHFQAVCEFQGGFRQKTSEILSGIYPCDPWVQVAWNSWKPGNAFSAGVRHRLGCWTWVFLLQKEFSFKKPCQSWMNLWTGWVVVSNILYLHLEIWGNDPIWLISMGWSHQTSRSCCIRSCWRMFLRQQ